MQSSSQAQSFKSILGRLEKIEELVDQLDSTQKNDIQDIKNQINSVTSDSDESDLEQSMNDIRQQLDAIKNSIEQLTGRNDSLEKELEELKEESASEHKVTEAEGLTDDLRGLLTELRLSIETATDADEEVEEEEGNDYGGVEFSGFFDVNASQFRESDNIFGLGPFEFDIEAPFHDTFGGSAALVFEDGVAEVGVGFVDIHLFKTEFSNSSPRGRIYTDPGYHLNIGLFDVPFGLDYLFYATPDRMNISAPLTTELVLDGGWTDLGIRAFKAHPSYNISAYTLNGFEDGFVSGTRFGVRPLANPFSSHAIREVPLMEIGLSGAYDVNKEMDKETTCLGIDLEMNIAGMQFVCEYMERDDNLTGLERNAVYAQLFKNIESLGIGVYGRYDEYHELAAGSVKTTTSRVTASINRELLGMSLVKLEYQYYPENSMKLSENDDVIMAQLAISF